MGTKRNIAVIVAHPDDETLWCGGEILANPDDNWFIASMCRGDDRDRAPKFKKAYSAYKASGAMAKIDDGVEQVPLPPGALKREILRILHARQYDLIITHSPFGEYTRHLRHEEVGRAVIDLWNEGKIACKELRLFAYEDGNRAYYPKAIDHAHRCEQVPDNLWKEKYRIITEIYGFEDSSFEAKTTPVKEAFWQFKDAEIAQRWMESGV